MGTPAKPNNCVNHFCQTPKPPPTRLALTLPLARRARTLLQSRLTLASAVFSGLLVDLTTPHPNPTAKRQIGVSAAALLRLPSRCNRAGVVHRPCERVAHSGAGLVAVVAGGIG